jgi:hypothetical protein
MYEPKEQTKGKISFKTSENCTGSTQSLSLKNILNIVLLKLHNDD